MRRMVVCEDEHDVGSAVSSRCCGCGQCSRRSGKRKGQKTKHGNSRCEVANVKQQSAPTLPVLEPVFNRSAAVPNELTHTAARVSRKRHIRRLLPFGGQARLPGSAVHTRTGPGAPDFARTTGYTAKAAFVAVISDRNPCTCTAAAGISGETHGQ